MNSKYNYILVGVSGIITLLCAALHLGFYVLVNGALTVWNWYVAQERRRLEEDEMLAIYKEHLQNHEDNPNE